MAVGLAQDLGDSAFSLGVISYSCWQVAEIKNGPQLPIQQVLLCVKLTGLSISKEGLMVRLRSSLPHVMSPHGHHKLGVDFISKAHCFMPLLTFAVRRALNNSFQHYFATTSAFGCRLWFN